MKMKRCLAAAAALAGAAGLWMGAWALRAPGQAQQQEPVRPLWVLRDDGGRLASYAYGAAADAPPVQTWQVYTALLPDGDLQKLRSGIPVYSEEQLRRLVEDLGG